VGDDVIALQDLLISKSYLASGYNTGYFGSLTQAAVIKFQSAYGISPASGRFGPITRATIAGLKIANVLTTSPITTTSTTTFTRDLMIGSQGDDVKSLQIFLNSHGFIVSESGAGSPGNETNYFGNATKSAVIRFQETYSDAILKPLGLTAGTGLFGEGTRGFVRERF
jgi:peptidoglycan hydrolase-like protein with peptidoglycan-binding domain